MIFSRTKVGKKVQNLIWWTNGQLRPVTEQFPESRSIGVLLLAVILHSRSLPVAVIRTKPSFTGSSLVEKWDVRRFFPTKVTYNAGLSGAGIDYVESQGKAVQGRKCCVDNRGQRCGFGE